MGKFATQSHFMCYALQDTAWGFQNLTQLKSLYLYLICMRDVRNYVC